MCCLPCSCAFKLQLVSVPASALVRAVGYEQHLLLLLLFFLLFFLLRAIDVISCGGTCSSRSRCYFCNYMCCLPCSCALKLQLVPVPALGSVRILGYEQYLLLRLLFFLLFFLLRAADAISCGGACSAICRCCFYNSMCCLSCSCAFKLEFLIWISFGPWV